MDWEIYELFKDNEIKEINQVEGMSNNPKYKLSHLWHAIFVASIFCFM